MKTKKRGSQYLDYRFSNFSSSVQEIHASQSLLPTRISY